MDHILTQKTRRWLYPIIFLLALSIRLMGVNDVPLTEWDAGLAIQALDISKGAGTSPGTHPLYTLITAGLFLLFEPSNFWARFFPALAGASLVFLPALLNRHFEEKILLPWSLMIALSPGFIGSTRWDGGSVVGMTVALFALTFFMNGNAIKAGIFGGLALLGGEGTWLGVIGLLTAGWLSGIVFGKELVSTNGEMVSDLPVRRWKKVVPWVVGTYLLIGSGLFLFPRGIGGLASSFQGFVSRLVEPGGVSPIRILVALISTEPLILPAGIVGIILVLIQSKRAYQKLAVWALVALVMTLIPAGRQVPDLAWFLIPMTGLSSYAMICVFAGGENEPRIIWAQGIVVVILSVIIGFNLQGIFNPSSSPIQDQQRLIQMITSFVLVIVVIGLVWWGWSGSICAKGTMLSALLVLGSLSLATGFRVLGMGSNPEMNIWLKSGFPLGEDLVIQTIGDSSEWATGNRNQADVVVLNTDFDSLFWSLNDYETVQRVELLPLESQPSIVISGKDQPLISSSSYRGQDFSYLITPTWGEYSFQDWIQWMVIHEGRFRDTQVIVWIRGDLMPGSSQY